MSQATAHHEAGHSITAWVHRIRFTCVSIRAMNGRAGTTYARSVDLDTEAGIDHRGQLFAAGGLAEAMFEGRGAGLMQQVDSPDARGLAAACELLDETNPDRMRRLLILKTSALLASRWAAVDAIAGALLAKRVLTPAEVNELAVAAGAKRYPHAGALPSGRLIDPRFRLTTQAGVTLNLREWATLSDAHGHDQALARRELTERRQRAAGGVGG